MVIFDPGHYRLFDRHHHSFHDQFWNQLYQVVRCAGTHLDWSKQFSKIDVRYYFLAFIQEYSDFGSSP